MAEVRFGGEESNRALLEAILATPPRRDGLTAHGVMPAARLCVAVRGSGPSGPEELFGVVQVDGLVAIVDKVRDAAVAA